MKKNIKIIFVIALTLILSCGLIQAIGGRDVESGNVVIIGETNVSMVNLTIGQLKGPIENIGSIGRNSTQINFINSFDTNNQNLVNAGYYMINKSDNSNVIGSIYFNSPNLILITKNVEGENVESYVKNSDIYFDIRTNLEHIATDVNQTVDIEIRDADDVKRDILGVTLSNITGNANVVFNGTDTIGEYTANIKTVESSCNGVEAKSEVVKFRVMESGVTLISNTYIDETLTISGIYNRDNYPLIITIEDNLNTIFTSNLILENNSFSMNFDTSDWRIGEYIVKVDDSDGNIDEVEFQVLEQKPLPTPEVISIATPTPTVESKPTPNTPGFEILLAIASIFLVSYRIRKNK